MSDSVPTRVKRPVPPWLVGKNFQKGKSGNPNPYNNGSSTRRPITEAYKWVISLPIMLAPAAKAKFKRKFGFTNFPATMTVAQLIALAQSARAVAGATDAAREIADRVEGRVSQPIELPDVSDATRVIRDLYGLAESEMPALPEGT